MKKRLLCLFLGVILAFTFTGNALSEENGLGVMRPDDQTMQKWYESYESAPKAYIDKSLEVAPTGALNLLNYLYYDPVERNQGGCGNCWAWAGNGVP